MHPPPTHDPPTRPNDEPQTDAVVAWLDSGARRAIISIDVSNPSSAQDLAAWSAQLPASRHRLVASFRARDLAAGGGDGGGEAGLGEALRSTMAALRPVVGCVQVDFEGEYTAAAQVCAMQCRQQ